MVGVRFMFLNNAACISVYSRKANYTVMINICMSAVLFLLVIMECCNYYMKIWNTNVTRNLCQYLMFDNLSINQYSHRIFVSMFLRKWLNFSFGHLKEKNSGVLYLDYYSHLGVYCSVTAMTYLH